MRQVTHALLTRPPLSHNKLHPKNQVKVLRATCMCSARRQRSSWGRNKLWLNMFGSGWESLGNSVPVYCSGSTSFDVRSWKISLKNFQGLLSIVQLSMFFVVAVSCDSFYIISKCFMFVNNFFKLFFVAFFESLKQQLWYIIIYLLVCQ